MPSDLTEWLNTLAKIAGDVGTNLPGTAGTVANVIAVALRFAADLTDQGIDPIEHIERIHAADSALTDVESGWAERLREKFGSAPSGPA